MSILQRLAAIVLAFVLSIGTAAGALAQADATPDAGTPASGTPSASGDLAQVGDEVPIYSSDTGDEVATITVNDVTDPFEDYDDYSAPARGSRYIAVDYTITNEVPNDSLDSPVYSLGLSSSEGLLLTSTYVGLPNDSNVTELSTDPILGGESATGTLFYNLPDDTKLGGLYYTGYGYYTLLADLGGTQNPAVGDDVTVYNANGDEYAAVTVTDYQDPFEDYSEYSAPESGSRVIAATVSLQNLISNDGIDFSQYDFSLQTSTGLLVSSTYVEPADSSDLTPLEDGRVAGGDSAEGTIFFVLPEEAEVSGIIFQPESGIVVNVGNPNV